MAAPANEEIRELERLLLVAAETGEMREFGSLQEELALGHDDLSKMLDTLREHGKAIEAAPGEWRGPTQDELDTLGRVKNGDGPVVVSVDPPAAEDERADHAEGRIAAGSAYSSAWEPTVRLTMAIAKALDAAAIGALIKAGIDDAAENEEAFVLEVLP